MRLPDRGLDRQFWGHPLEERRTLDVGGGRVPGVENGLGSREVIPVGITGCDLAVNFLENIN